MLFTVCHTAASAGGEEPSRTPASYSSDSLSRTENLSPVHTEPSFWTGPPSCLWMSPICAQCPPPVLFVFCKHVACYIYITACVFQRCLVCFHVFLLTSPQCKFIHHSDIIIRYLSIQQYTALTEEWRDDAAVPNISLNWHCFKMVLIEKGISFC